MPSHPPNDLDLSGASTLTSGYTGPMLHLLQASAIVAACVLLPGTLTAQEPEVSSAPEPRFSASISLDSNHGADGRWMQLTPGGAYTMSPRVSVEGGVPVYYLTSGATYAGTASIGGIGDAYGSLSLDLSPGAATFYTTVTLSAPTGNVEQGLGAGRTSWDWTTHLAGGRGRFGPYASGGAANNIKAANESLRRGAGTARAGAEVSTGNLAHAEAGLDVSLWKSLSVTASAYGVFSLESQTPATPAVPLPRPGARPPGPAARRRLSAGAAAGTRSATDDVSDHGLGLVFWEQVTSSFDVSFWISHSLAYDHYTVFSVSATYTLTPSLKSKRSGSGRP